MTSFYMNTIDSIKMAAKHPFGIDFEIYEKKIYIPIGSALNCLGYNDFLERIIGVARVAVGLIALIYSNDHKERAIAGGHVFRGILEMAGSYERELLILDALFTVYNIFQRFIKKDEAVKPMKNDPALATAAG